MHKNKKYGIIISYYLKKKSKCDLETMIKVLLIKTSVIHVYKMNLEFKRAWEHNIYTTVIGVCTFKI